MFRRAGFTPRKALYSQERQERAQSLLSILALFKPEKVVILKCFQRLLGLMAAAVQHLDECAVKVAHLELKAVFLALQHFLLLVKDRHVLIRTDNTTVVSYINHQGGIRSRSLQWLAERSLIWADRNLLSDRAVCVLLANKRSPGWGCTLIMLFPQ